MILSLRSIMTNREIDREPGLNRQWESCRTASAMTEADMMLLPTLDTALRAGTVAVLLLVAALLVRDARATVSGRLAIALVLGTVIHATSSIAGFAPPITPWRVPVIALSTANVVVLWLFAQALFDDGFRLRPWHAVPWALVAGISLVNCLWPGPWSVVMSVIALGFIALTLGQTVATWSADLVESRRRLRVFIVTAAAVYGAVDSVLQFATAVHRSSEFAATANAAMLAGITLAIAYSMLQVGAESVFAAPAVKPVAPTSGRVVSIQADRPNAADQKLIETLTRLMDVERIYRDENISIGTLALRLKVPEYRLRRLINQRLGYRNFNVFINDHRIEEARAALADPAQAGVPVITIAMDAGFQSLGPFNRAFKDKAGVTPSEYRRLHAIPAPSSKPLSSVANFEIG
jgi:AraC-like DNA-binding protein